MKEAGAESHIRVISLQEYEQEFFDFESYRELRVLQPFGSAVDSRTGENDQREFVPVRYTVDGGKQDLTIGDIAEKLIRGGTVVLTGDYGTGKSRCVREIFTTLSKSVTESGAYPVAINLRDHWSSSNALEIIAGHLGNIGLQGSVDNIVRLLNAGGLVLLLDGFDEIGTQVHDPKARDRRALRKHAVRGLRDLIIRAKAGVLLTGRSHFFDSDKEMFESLGVANSHNVTIARVPDNFTEAEAAIYLSGLHVKTLCPGWLPRKPLVFQLLAEIDVTEVEQLLSKDFGEFEFWGAFFFAVCIRESRGVSESVSAETVREILLELAARSRYSPVFLGRLTPREIDEAYETVVGSIPDEAGRLLLARLCTLGRIEPESPDRQFIDHSLVDVLRAEHLVNEVSSMSERFVRTKWQQGLRVIGAIHAANLVEMYGLHNSCFSYIRKFGVSANSWMLGEIVSILSIVGTGNVDFHSLKIIDGYVPVLNLHGKSLLNLHISNSEIGVLDIDRTTVTSSHGISVDGCIINAVNGVSGPAGMPAWISGTDIIYFDQLSNASAIKQSDISRQNKLLLAIIHKIFFQRGAGREEAALRKGGYGQEYSAKVVGKILTLLMREGVIDRHKGSDGWIYAPVRSATARMNKIRSELSLSDDSIWREVSEFKD
ncbi:hypothetical protein B0E52_08550 [Rhodanobacter sp. C06]|nr:hypothetical protein B0E52_08550 [Rhodanobacter sp. C06]